MVAVSAQVAILVSSSGNVGSNSDKPTQMLLEKDLALMKPYWVFLVNVST